ncbi:MAG: hypothetical protein ABSH50_31640 [Bryobacteraceae bacterium]
MFRIAPVIVALSASVGAFAASTPPLVCPAGGPIGSIDLRVASPRGKGALPMRTINRLDAGDTILYKPVLNGSENRHGEVTIVLVPASKTPRGEKLLVLESKPAAQPEQWHVPWRVSVIAYAYGPSGLSTKKVASFLSKSDELVGQLADYAAKTAETEALIAALSAAADGTPAVMQSTLQGFASQYGLKVQLDSSAAGKQQALTMFQALNPAMANYDPIAPDVSQQFGRTAGLAASVAAMFFGSPVGLAAGGTAMLMDLHALAFPGSQFRSSFSEPRPNDGLGLCGKTDAPPAHTRLVYLWASRVSNAAAPQVAIGKDSTVPKAMKSAVTITASDADLKLLDHIRDWALQPEKGKALPIKVQAVDGAKTLQIDLDKELPAGTYTLAANWDWEHMAAKGRIEVRDLSDFEKAHLNSASQDKLTAKAGKERVTLEGADFEFVTKAELKNLNDEFSAPAAVPFVLPVGLREGPQPKMDLQIDTSDLDPGPYKLLLTQVDGKNHPVVLKILPASPTIDNLPLIVNQGNASAEFHLKGHHLELLKAVDLSGGEATLDAPGTDGVDRGIRLKLAPTMKFGTTLGMTARVEDRSEPLSFSDAVHIVGPRPKILDVNLTLPPDSDVRLESGELPGSSLISGMLHVDRLEPDSVVRLSCAGEAAATAFSMRLGDHNGPSSFQQLTPGEIFLSLDTGRWLNGCALQAVVSNGVAGDSEPRALGAIVRIPNIQSLEVAAANPQQTPVDANLVGQNLETIGKLGWNADDGLAVQSLPLAVSGAGTQQTLRTVVPAPPTPDATLYVWLRGEIKARVTTVHPTVMN